MPQSLVATVTPFVASRPSFQGGSVKGKKLSAPGCKEFTIGQAMPMGATRPRAHLSQIDRQAPYAQAEKKQEREYVQDSDDEVFVLCPHCHLPLGDCGYTADDDEGRLVHAECKAQILLKRAKREEESRLKKDAVLKKKRREEYDLGWKVERVPRNAVLAMKLACGLPADGLCGIMWNRETKAAQVVPTADHAASVNLEYLALAMRVRMQEGREAMFSLDPKVLPEEPKDKTQMWQVKRFEPAWLEGTSLGEVMFQADYHLKELSMGEHDQPVLGMKSSFDLSEMEGLTQDWSAREWFVVNKAEVQVTQDQIVVPVVKMGVEARETRRSENGGLEDVPLTRPNHPLVKYAESFTHYFDLIAERKSVVYHLRELARASVLAKFLVENEAKLDGSWTGIAGASQQFQSIKEIPQLWNEHKSAQIEVSGGQIVNSQDGIQTRMFGVYGGAELDLARAGRVGVRVPPPKVMAARVPTLTARMISARGTVPEFAVGAPGVPKGVDLNLDNFNIGDATVAKEEVPAAWSGKDFMGRSFWENQDKLEKEHKVLLQDIYHPGLSDRRQDGELFMPPSNSSEYITALQKLLKEEASIRQQRQEQFLSEEFVSGNPGSLFPFSWTPSLDVQSSAGARQGLHSRPDYKADAARLIKSATPNFDKCTEDGTRFRIYQVGSIEVRSIQEEGSEEEVGAVFSGRAAMHGGLASGEYSMVAGVDRIIKVSEYVESTQSEARRFYVVLETDQGDMILTEKVKGKKAVWAENPAGLEYRNSLAKVVRAADLEGAALMVRDARRMQGDVEGMLARLSRAANKHYAHEAFLALVPARQKAFAALSERELECAEELGVSSAAAWDEGSAEVFRQPWATLGAIRQEAARVLGYSEQNWGVSEKKEEKVEEVKAPEKKWEELSKAEQEEKMAKWFHEHYCSGFMGSH